MALRNEDFRKLLASTPRRTVPETPSRNEGNSHSFTHKSKPKFKAPHPKNNNKFKKVNKTEEDEEEQRLKEILKSYRDRAAERREKGGTDETEELAKLTAAYQAVPGSTREARDAAHARRQAIEESKFLGGDMEHTHLVKGLDYSLLHKVRSEIERFRENDEREDLEKTYKEIKEAEAAAFQPTAADSKMVKSIQQILFKNELPLRNDLFKKGRMAYVVEMEEENQDDVPTTLLRSLIDCPNNESNSNINANNMLISKLTQVLSYLRADHKKKKKPDMSEEDMAKYQSQNIYENEADYVPKREKDKEKDRKEDKDKDKDRDRKKTSSYFDDRDKDKDRDRDRRDRDYDRRDRDRDRRRDDYDRRDREKDKDREREKEREREKKEKEQAEKEKRLEEKMEKRRKEMESGGYEECYPGGFAELGGSWGDSDEEEDFSKMDLGNKKSGIKRWDFDNQDDYEKFQGGREAVPKAAFQFGLKTQDGRKTKKSEAASNKKLDRELQQIEKINEKRKATLESGGDYKKPKY